jgi:membrane protease YdiL (CAAX protease family)
VVFLENLKKNYLFKRIQSLRQTLNQRDSDAFRAMGLCIILFLTYGLSGVAEVWNYVWLYPDQYQAVIFADTFALVYFILWELSCLFLLKYILSVNRQTWRDLGLRFSWADFWHSLPLAFAALLVRDLLGVAYNGAAGLPWFFGYEIKTVAHVSGWAVLAMLINPVFEETIVRGYFMTEFRRLTNQPWLAAVLSALVQLGVHFYQTPGDVVSLIGLFLVFSFYYMRTQRLLPLILAHLYLDMAALFMN